jgi:hypothetical protein
VVRLGRLQRLGGNLVVGFGRAAEDTRSGRRDLDLGKPHVGLCKCSSDFTSLHGPKDKDALFMQYSWQLIMLR